MLFLSYSDFYHRIHVVGVAAVVFEKDENEQKEFARTDMETVVHANSDGFKVGV